MWTAGKCPYFSDRGCRMAAQIAGLPVDTCPVTAAQCADCLSDHEPLPDGPNVVVGQIAREAVIRHQPGRVKQWAAKYSVPYTEPKPLTEADVPCIHRGEIQWEHVAGGGCCGGDPSTANVYACKLKGRECTVFPKTAIASDGQPPETCVACRERHVRAREPERTINYIQSANGKPCGAAWAGRYSGSVFLVCGGPSLNEMDLSPLTQRGIAIAAVNNVAASHVRPHFWFCADEPLKFHQAIYADPAIACFVKANISRKHTRRLDGEQSIPGPPVTDYPNVWLYDHAGPESLKPTDFLACDGPLWPRDTSVVRRSVMLPALRMLVDFGFTTIYLLGCDFNMEVGVKSEDSRGSYAFDEGKDAVACRSNNRLYESVDAFLTKVDPVLKASGVNVFNCTPGGNLTAFERMPFAEAVDNALREFPKVESLFGYYWRAA